MLRGICFIGLMFAMPYLMKHKWARVVVTVVVPIVMIGMIMMFKILTLVMSVALVLLTGGASATRTRRGVRH
jgi:hypothetical protein